MSDDSDTIGANPPDGFTPFGYGEGFANHIGPIFQGSAGAEAKLGFRVMPYHCNPAGICHGGMMMTVMDIVIGMNTSLDAGTGVFTPSVNLTYDFIRPGMAGEWLESKLEWVHTTKRTGFANAYLIGPKGPVMRANGICKIPDADDPRFQFPGGRKMQLDRPD